MSPQDITSRFLQGVNRVAVGQPTLGVGLVADGEHPSVGHRDGGNASANRGVPKSLGPA